jgi:hypothetical protein
VIDDERHAPGLESAAEAQAVILNMVESGKINAKISQTDEMVSFQDSSEHFDTAAAIEVGCLKLDITTACCSFQCLCMQPKAFVHCFELHFASSLAFDCVQASLLCLTLLGKMHLQNKKSLDTRAGSRKTHCKMLCISDKLATKRGMFFVDNTAVLFGCAQVLDQHIGKVLSINDKLAAADTAVLTSSAYQLKLRLAKKSEKMPPGISGGSSSSFGALPMDRDVFAD